MIEVLGLHLFLVSLTVIKVVEVGDDDGHGQSDRQHTSDRAQRPHDFPPDSHRPEAHRKRSSFYSERHRGLLAWKELRSSPRNSVLGVVFLSCVSLPCRVECGATYAVLEAPIDTHGPFAHLPYSMYK